jgi:hypothetical protein
VYLRGLAAADLAVLHVGLLLDWINFVSDIDIKLIHPFFCKTSLWLIYACADTSVWLLMAVTFERVMHTLYPMKSKSVCTKLCAKFVLLFIIIGALAINSHLLFGFGTLEIETVDNKTMEIPCAPLSKEYEYFFSKVWIWIGMCKFSLIPFVVLTIGNVCILYTLVKSKRKIYPLSSTIQSSSLPYQRTYSILLVALNIVFITCTLPVAVYFIGEPYWIPKDLPMKIKHQDPWWCFVNMLMYTNSCMNFALNSEMDNSKVLHKINFVLLAYAVVKKFG